MSSSNPQLGVTRLNCLAQTLGHKAQRALVPARPCLPSPIATGDLIVIVEGGPTDRTTSYHHSVKRVQQPTLRLRYRRNDRRNDTVMLRPSSSLLLRRLHIDGAPCSVRKPNCGWLQ